MYTIVQVVSDIKTKISKILKQKIIYNVCKLPAFKEASVLYSLQLCSFCNHKTYNAPI